jgi:hypothetical protein
MKRPAFQPAKAHGLHLWAANDALPLTRQQRKLNKANQTCRELAGAARLAHDRGDEAAARYFEAELKLAKAKRDALAASPCWYMQRHHVWRAVLAVTALLWAALFFFTH